MNNVMKYILNMTLSLVMNNLLPSSVKMHLKFDLKGSTYKRKVCTYNRIIYKKRYKCSILLRTILFPP